MKMQRFEEVVMGTRGVVSLPAEVTVEIAAGIAALAFEVMRDFESDFSMFRTDSELSRISGRSGEWTKVSARMMEAIRYACDIARETDGVFSPLVGTLTAPRREPRDAVGDWRSMEFEESQSSLRLPAGAWLDLNAVAKGWAIDAALATIPADVPTLVEIGGDLRVRGRYDDGGPWPIGIRRPDNPRLLLAVVPIDGEAICTSGQYFRGEQARGEHRSHLIDARGGCEPEFVTSFTVVAPTAREADVLSTAGFLLPPPAAVALVEGHRDCSCLFVMSDGSVHASASFEKRLRDFVTGSPIHQQL